MEKGKILNFLSFQAKYWTFCLFRQNLLLLLIFDTLLSSLLIQSLGFKILADISSTPASFTGIIPNYKFKCKSKSKRQPVHWLVFPPLEGRRPVNPIWPATCQWESIWSKMLLAHKSRQGNNRSVWRQFSTGSRFVVAFERDCEANEEEKMATTSHLRSFVSLHHIVPRNLLKCIKKIKLWNMTRRHKRVLEK